MKDIIEITYKEFFEQAKSHPEMQKVIIQCFVTATKMVCRLRKSGIDIGDLVLNSLSTMTEIFNGIKLMNKEEITAEYMADIINSYQIRSGRNEIRRFNTRSTDRIKG